MVESAIAQLGRKWDQAVLPAFRRDSLLGLFPTENIGGLDVREWAKKVIIAQKKAHMQKHGGKWGAGGEAINIQDFRLEIYDTQYRIELSKAEMAFVAKTGLLPAGKDEALRHFMNKINHNLFLGVEAGDQFEQATAQYNFIRDPSTGNGTIGRPLPISNASAAVKWDAAGGAQKDSAKLAGNMRKLGKDPRMSIVFYPEVCAEVFARPIVSGTSVFLENPVKVAFTNQGFIDCLPVEDALLTRQDDGATPTVEEFDIFGVHIPDIDIGIIQDLTSEIIYDPVDKVYYVDMQMIWCPLKIPIQYDTDSKYYSGIGIVTACDANT